MKLSRVLHFHRHCGSFLFYRHGYLLSFPVALLHRDQVSRVLRFHRLQPAPAFGYAKLHLARRKIGDHDRESAFELLRVVAGFYSCEDGPLLRSYSSVSFSNLSAPSTCSALTIFATLRSTLAKSSIVIAGARADAGPPHFCPKWKGLRFFYPWLPLALFAVAAHWIARFPYLH